MRTGGVDLAAENTRTALAIISWDDHGAHLERLDVGVSDADIVAAAEQVDKLGIDCAFGWPDDFVAFVRDHADLRHASPPDGGIEWRRRLAYRETDRVVRSRTGRWPLSVATDRLGLTAMRCAALLERLSGAGIVVDRSGETGAVAEVYPGASARAWRVHVKGYRVDVGARRAVVDAVQRAAPWLSLGDQVPRLIASPDALDAVLAALAARAAALGRSERPDADQIERARREGWIVLPTGDLAELR